jgi:hypothetical protein
MKASDAFWIFVFAAVAFVLFAPKVTKNIETNHRKELAKASYPGCGNRDCECYEDCSCIDGICVCGGPKPPAPPKPKPKPDPDVPPDDVGPELAKSDCVNPVCQCNAGGTPCKCDKCECGLQPLKVSTVQDAHLFENGQATILLYSLPGCGPCEKWWRDEAPGWVNRGWKVKRTTSKTTRHVPYFTLYDGAQFFEYFIQKDIDKFKFDGAGR